MMVNETMDYPMSDIIKHGCHVLMSQPMKDKVKDSDEIQKLAHEFTKYEKDVVSLDVKAHAAIGNTLPYASII